MVTQEQAITMQSDINGVLLKMKSLQDAEEDQTEFKEEIYQIVKRHEERIE
jgi:hypothetical protein